MELARIEAERRAAEERRLAEAKRQRAVRLVEIERRGGGGLYVGKLDELDPGWRDQDEPKVAAAETALTHAQEELARIEAERRAAEERRLAKAKRQCAVRRAEVERRGGGGLYAGKLDELDPGWPDRGEPKVAAAETALNRVAGGRGARPCARTDNRGPSVNATRIRSGRHLQWMTQPRLPFCAS